MGIASDILEDSLEAAGQAIYPIEYIRFYRDLPQEPPPPPVFVCPVCEYSVFSDDELRDHIQKTHGKQHVYLCLNGCVVRGMTLADRGIDECRLILLGYPRAEVRVTAGKRSWRASVKSEGNLGNIIPRKFEGELHITVTPQGGPEKTFTVYNYVLPDFRKSELDVEVSALQRKIDRTRKRIDLGQWRTTIFSQGFTNSIETRYINAFFEYSLGFCLEREGKRLQAKEHLEDAFGLLWPFRTDLSHTARCVLGIKMNCFTPLRRCSDSSPFAGANDFFNKKLRDREKPVQALAESEVGVYVDDFTMMFLDSIKSFYERNEKKTEQLLASLQVHSGVSETNNEDKVHILKARVLANCGDSAGAREQYEYLKHNPFFGTEAQEYLK